MTAFLRARRIGKGKKDYISDLTKIAKEEREKILREKVREIIIEELQSSGINKRIDDISTSFISLDKKLENLHSFR